MAEEKMCRECKEVKTIDEFYTNSIGLKCASCKACRIKYQRSIYKKKRAAYLARLESEKLNNKEELI